MKQFTIIAIISLFMPLFGMSQTKTTIDDDLYFKPSDVKILPIDQTQNRKTTPNFKNGAKEIVYIERVTPATNAVHDTVYVEDQANNVLKNRSSNVVHGIIHDTIYISGTANDNRENSTLNSDTAFVVSEANDSTNNNQEQGYYLNGFKGTQNDLEYAERIRHFHNPRYEIFIGDPRYNDIYFLNDYDWNVYIDGSYAYVTPTWTNPYWWNYNFNAYSYGNWGFGFNNYYSPFFSWYDYPWAFDDFYGGSGYYGYGYGSEYGYPYYGYGNGYNRGGKNWYSNGNSRFLNHDEGNRREVSNLSTAGRVGTMNKASQSLMIGGGNSNTTNPYTVVSSMGSSKVNKNNINNSSGSRSINISNGSTSRTISINRDGIGLVRTGGLRNLSSSYQNNSNAGVSRTATTYSINTNPRTSITRNNSTSITTSNSSNVYSGTSRNSYTTSNSGNYSTTSRSNSPSESNNNSNFNNAGSSSRSSGSYSGGGSSGSSSGGGSRGSSGGSSGGGGNRR
jgi:hypothetical protein